MKLWKKLTAAVLMSAAMLGAGLTAKPLFPALAGAEITAQAEGETVTVGDLTFELTDTYAIVKSCSQTATTVSIPKTVNGLPVKIIGEAAFKNCEVLMKVSIPNGVTSIRKYAFNSCKGLTEIQLSDTVKYIGGGAFLNCTDLTSISIPDGVKSINHATFEHCYNLKSITIPDSVTSIGSWAFNGCSSLTSVSIGNGVTSISRYAFYNCTSLTSITIPDGVPSIDECAFAQCTGLTSITIPNSVTKIYYGAFYHCRSLTSITLPDSMTFIGEDAFAYCFKLTSINIPDSVTSIGKVAFMHCYKLKSISIPKGVKSINFGTFEYCFNLKSITIPDSVTSIGNHAFDKCTDLVIYGKAGSFAERYASGQFAFCVLGKNAIDTVTLSQETFSYTGKEVKVGRYLTVKSGGKKLKYGTDFTLAYYINIRCGVERATVKIVGIGEYDGCFFPVVYSIGPALSTKKGRLHIEWSSVEGADGYQVQYCQDPSFTGDTVHTASVTKLYCDLATYPKAGETWYVRVRSFTTTSSGGKNYGAWSGASSITLATIDNVSLKYTAFHYKDGAPVKVGKYLTVYSGDNTKLKYGKDFTLVYKNNVKRGTASVTIKGIGEYAGSSVSKTYRIV